MTPHRWQLEATTFLNMRLDTADYAYIQAPTGVGKTFAIVLHGDQSPVQGACLIIVGTHKVMRQHRQTLLDLGFRQLAETETDFWSPTGRLWIVTTWQSVAHNAKRYLRSSGIGIQYFDECHLGGRHRDNVSYRRIVEALRPEKKVHVSATTNVASEKLLGVRENHSYVYTLSSAYEDGLLNPVNIVEVPTGTTIVIERLEAELGKSIEDIEELTDERLENLAHKAKIKGVGAPKIYKNPVSREELDATKAAKAIIKHRHDAMIDLYLSNHAGESAIFWCSNVDAAERARTSFTHLSSIPAATVHSKAGENDDLIAQFEQGRIKVIFAVQMLQEGFNMPKLSLAFDCRFHRQLNKYRVARMLQRIGRLTRKADGKPISTYYVAPDLMHYYNTSASAIPTGSLLAMHLLAAGDAIAETDFNAALPVFASEDIDLEVSENQDEHQDEHQEDNEPRPRGDGTDKIKAKATPLYVIRAARGYTEGAPLPLHRLFDDGVTTAKADLIRRAATGESRPKHSTIDGKNLNYWATNDRVFRAAIQAANHKWVRDRAMSVADRKAWILAQEAYPNDMAQYIYNYSSPTSSSYDPTFAAAYKAKSWVREYRPGKLNPKRDASRERTFAKLLALDEKPKHVGRGVLSNEERKEMLVMCSALWRFIKNPHYAEILKREKPHWFTADG